MLMHALQSLLLVLSPFCLAGNIFAGGDFKPDLFRGVKAGQKFRCEAKADYLAEHYLSGSIESNRNTLKNLQLEIAGALTVIQVMEAQPSGLELKIEKFSCLENGVKYPPGLDGKILFIRRDGSSKTVFTFKESGNAVPAKDATLLGMVFDLGTIEPAGRTIWGYPGTIHAGSTWGPDLELFRSQLLRLNFHPEKLEGRATFKAKRIVQGVDCLLLDMDINCLLVGGETCIVTSHAAFPADNAIYGPVKNELRILRKRQIKLPETEPLAAGQIMHSEEKFQLETLILPLKLDK